MTDDPSQGPNSATVADPRIILVASQAVLGQWPMAFAPSEPVVLVGTRDLDGIVQTILRDRATVVVEQAVASSDPGHDFLRRLQWHPTFVDLDVRIIEGSELVGLMTSPPPAAEVAGMLAERAQPLEPLPYRSLGRIRVDSSIPILVKGTSTILVDLSPTGVAVISPVTLRPNQRVLLTLPEEDNRAKIPGTVVWCAFELPRSGIVPSFYDNERLADMVSASSDATFTLRLVGASHYRTGIVFANPKQEVIERFFNRVQQLERDLIEDKKTRQHTVPAENSALHRDR